MFFRNGVGKVVILLAVLAFFAVFVYACGGSDDLGTSPDGVEVDRSSDGLENGLNGSATTFRGSSRESQSASQVIVSTDYRTNLALLKAGPYRNTNHDDSPYADVPSDQLNPEDHYGPRSEYLNDPGDNPEQTFPVASGGQFRAGCEFSHFGYDDPIVFPDQPGAAHLHMFFGNTDVNAYSTYETLINSGSSTCNGQELNRTGYWAPAMFDGQGNVRIPERIVVYYKGEGLANGRAEVFPERAAMIANPAMTLEGDINAIAPNVGGAAGKSSFKCSDNFSGPESPVSNTMISCDGNRYTIGNAVNRTVLEMNVKFPQCWNGEDPSDPSNFRIPRVGGWYFSECEEDRTLVNLEYFINYVVEPGENTADWFLSSDVDPMNFNVGAKGGTVHADWWGGWHKETNQLFIDNCVNNNSYSGCGFGFLTSGANGEDGPALQYRPQYEGPNKVPAAELFEALCPQAKHSYDFGNSATAAYCTPAGQNHG